MMNGHEFRSKMVSVFDSVIIAIIIFSFSIASFLLGAGILGIFMLGPIGFAAAPFLSIFGWFYFPLIVIGQTGSWFWWKRTGMSRIRFCLRLAGIAAAFFVIFGIKEDGRLLLNIAGYALGAFIPGFLSLWTLTSIRPGGAHPGNGEGR